MCWKCVCVFMKLEMDYEKELADLNQGKRIRERMFHQRKRELSGWRVSIEDTGGHRLALEKPKLLTMQSFLLAEGNVYLKPGCGC